MTTSFHSRNSTYASLRKLQVFFDIERRDDNSAFRKIGNIPGCKRCTAQTNYSFTDNAPYTGFSYYRLKQIAIDGKFIYSNIAEVSLIKQSINSLVVFPGITSSRFKAIIQNEGKEEKAHMSLYNSSGQVLMLHTQLLRKGENRIEFNLSDYKPGQVFFNHPVSVFKTQNNKGCNKEMTTDLFDHLLAF